MARVGFVYKDIGGAALFIDSLPAVRDGSKHDLVQLERPITISLCLREKEVCACANSIFAKLVLASSTILSLLHVCVSLFPPAAGNAPFEQ